MNGVNSLIIQKRNVELYKLTRLLLPLNTDEGKQINKQTFGKKSGNTSFDNVTIERPKHKKTSFPRIKVCLQFKELGQHIIDLTPSHAWPHDPYRKIVFRFYFKVDKYEEVKCVSHILNKIDDVLFIINKLKKGIEIYGYKSKFEDSKEGKMIVDFREREQNGEIIAEILPLFDESSYKFSNPVVKENNKGEEKIVETNNRNKKGNNSKGKMKGGSSNRTSRREEYRSKGKEKMVESENETEDETEGETEDETEDETDDETDDETEYEIETRLKMESLELREN